MALMLPYPPAAMDKDEAAAYLSVSASTIENLQRKGDLIPVSVGGAKRFRRTDLDQYVNNSPDWDDRNRN